MPFTMLALPHRPACRAQKQKSHSFARMALLNLAEWTGLEPATPGVTGRYSNQLNYHSWQEALLTTS